MGSFFPTDDSLLKRLYLATMDRKSGPDGGRLQPDPRPAGHLLRPAYARVTPLWPDVKGFADGYAALSIHPHRGVMMQTERQRV